MAAISQLLVWLNAQLHFGLFHGILAFVRLGHGVSFALSGFERPQSIKIRGVICALSCQTGTSRLQFSWLAAC